ncbi:M20/M25/M40 family metallo-hydrolase [uncultured Sphaerochaeta sp.]|uniref:M20/M25/M40 family metallo-hydrolase n=1 Tax=uncultured Sphaerochaeta sp. TaxID=886478 RepID=UPI002A0A5872|nr:M20/M25/M40 family metallo-hydrolase [uncultured Sphaerochaeta sp.]
MNSVAKTFLELVAINSVSRHEEAIGKNLFERLQKLGLSTEQDEAGNLFAYLAGEGETIMLNAHMDTVPPAENAKVIVSQGIIKTDNTTALGADDKAALAAILTVLERIRENDIAHPNLLIVCTVSEEISLVGASQIDMDKLSKVTYGYTFDASGPLGTCITAGPGHDKIQATFKGKASHAGFSPELGISAIQMGAEAIACMHLLKIDSETTANVGSFLAPGCTNIVNDTAYLAFEARSLNAQKLEQQTNHMISCLQKAADTYGGTVDIQLDHMYGSYSVPTDAPVFQYLRDTIKKIGLPYREQPTLGGSDANIFNQKGLPTVVCSIGYKNPHTLYEEISLEDLDKLEQLVFGLATR